MERVNLHQPSGRTAGGAMARERLLAALPVSERRIELGGISTSVLEGGHGEPLVLLHGALGHGAAWLAVLPELVSSYRVIAPDLPGHGDSGGADGAVDVERMLRWMDDLITKTCSAPPILCGQTLGGAVALRYAAARSSRLRGLVLVGALGLRPFQPNPEFGAAVGAFMTEPSDTSHDELWARCVFQFDELRGRLGPTWEALKAYNVDRARAPELQAAQQSLMQLFAAPEIPDGELARITVPTAMIWSRHDPVTPVPVAEAVGKRHGWSFRVIEDAGDEPALEQPKAFAGTLRTLIGDQRWHG